MHCWLANKQQTSRNCKLSPFPNLKLNYLLNSQNFLGKCLAPFGSCHAELKRSFFESLMPSYIKLTERAKPFKPTSRIYKVYNDYSSPPKSKIFGGYTIGSEAGGGDSGSGDDLGDGGGGGDWGSGSDGGGDGGDSGDASDYFGLLIFFGVGTVTTKILYDYFFINFKIISGMFLEAWQVKNKHKLERSRRPTTLQRAEGIEPRKRAIAGALVPVLFSGSALAVLSYVLHVCVRLLPY
uniref:Uncharacterized protein n=1 Tax=Halimeda minima TaxID=170427 RepID=A0A386AYW3_9CHLO|nr:hypothetical protein [Halimeda minima]